jgi:3-hydroxybutyryl-CoA dehydrogenase
MKIAVIGMGVMGSGVAQRFAMYNNNVIAVDISEEIMESSRKTILNNIRFFNMFSKEEKISTEEILGQIEYTKDYSKLNDADFVIENVTEKFEIKKDVYQQLDLFCHPQCIFLANTSCISITKIGGFTRRPDKVIGAHFMNPVPVKKAAEVIKGYYTSENTLQEVKELLGTVEVLPIVVNDYPGFVSNRISHLLMNEAAWVVQDGVASPEDVDAIFKLCFEHKMGPLETADLIGLDVVVDSLDVLYESYQDSKFRTAPLLRKMVDAKLFGRKSGEGFYKY